MHVAAFVALLPMMAMAVPAPSISGDITSISSDMIASLSVPTGTAVPTDMPSGAFDNPGGPMVSASGVWIGSYGNSNGTLFNSTDKHEGKFRVGLPDASVSAHQGDLPASSVSWAVPTDVPTGSVSLPVPSGASLSAPSE